MTSIAERNVDALRGALRGTVLTAGDADYDQARSVWNGEIDRRPAVIARCAGPEDVAAALAFAREQGLEVAVRGGGHNFGGMAVCDGGLVVDLTPLKSVTVDPDARTVRCGAGLTWAELDAATQQHGLAVPGGTVSHTGISGLTLGGGLGWLTGAFGLSCDNLIAARVVTADGRILRAAADEHPELFWALRGGGGNFGVVTEFEFRAHPVGPLVRVGLFFWGAADGIPALRLARRIISGLGEDSGALIAGLNAPPAPFVPDEYHFAPGYALIVAGFGGEDAHASIAENVREGLTPLFEMVTSMPYVELQKLIDGAAPWGILAYEKGAYVDDLSEDVIAVITEHLPRRTSPMSIMPILPMQGAYTTIPEEATAFGGSRRGGYVVNMAGLATDPAVHAAEREWARTFWAALAPHASNSAGYVNFMNEQDYDRVRASYGAEKYERLSRIKAEYDPENVFHRNANIRPAQ
ncbi:FAD-binding oxidoreductase [Amycolatopsis sp. NPDC059021]|uniref:FAD-binding oxidoreductase n=1 Tax=Amycolatopsis sp. NPDC059021 TaxID=3346704 RepID=UPI00367275E4